MNRFQARNAAMLAGAAAAAALVATPLVGAPAAPAQARAEMLQKLTNCRKLTDNTARLACFDEAAAALDIAETKGDIVVVDRAQATAVRRQAFGFTLPSLSIFDRGEKSPPLERLTSTVTSAYQHQGGAWVLELEDGAVWTQTDDEPVLRDPRKGSKVEIRKAALGTYFINIDGQRAIRAKRTH